MPRPCPSRRDSRSTSGPRTASPWACCSWCPWRGGGPASGSRPSPPSRSGCRPGSRRGPRRSTALRERRGAGAGGRRPPAPRGGAGAHRHARRHDGVPREPRSACWRRCPSPRPRTRGGGPGRTSARSGRSIFVSKFLGMHRPRPAHPRLEPRRLGGGARRDPRPGRRARRCSSPGLVFTTHFVFGMRRDAGGSIPPLAYLCSPFLIWAALRFGLRAATLGLAAFGLICYWHTAQGLGPFAIAAQPTGGSLLQLQGYLATVVVTTLFAAALLVEREAAGADHRGLAPALRGGHPRERQPALRARPRPRGRSSGTATPGRCSAWRPRRSRPCGQWSERVHPDDRARLRGEPRAAALRRDRAHRRRVPRAARRGRVDHRGRERLRDRRPHARARRGRRRIIGFVSDVSERIRAEAERQALAAQLRQAEKMEAVGRLAGGIAHDFNNILGAILGYGELAQARVEADPQLKRYVDTIVNAGNRAKALVDADPRLQPRRGRDTGAGGPGAGGRGGRATCCAAPRRPNVEVRLVGAAGGGDGDGRPHAPAPARHEPRLERDPGDARRGRARDRASPRARSPRRRARGSRKCAPGEWVRARGEGHRRGHRPRT